MNTEISNRVKANSIESLNADMQRDASPIRKELDALILEAQARSIKGSAPYEK